MAEFESSGESIGHDPCSLQREEGSRERLQEEPISPREVGGDRADEGVAPPAANWNGETREILRGLAEEAGGDAIGGEGTADEDGQGARLSGRRGGRQIGGQRPTGRQLVRQRPTRPAFTLEQRLLIVDAWRRSGLPASEFAPLVGIVSHRLREWARAFEQEGPAGLAEKPRGARVGSRLPEATKRAILLLKQDHPEWGCQRISDVLLRGPALGACASALARVLHEAGYELEEVPTRPHAPAVHRFERAKPNQLWSRRAGIQHSRGGRAGDLDGCRRQSARDCFGAAAGAEAGRGGTACARGRSRHRASHIRASRLATDDVVACRVTGVDLSRRFSA